MSLVTTGVGQCATLVATLRANEEQDGIHKRTTHVSVQNI